MLSRRKGEAGEQRARRHLEQAGLEFVAANYRCRRGELDLVMRDGQVLVFVEVRLRSNPHYGSGADSIGAVKRRRLIGAALHYLQRYRIDVPCRFDVVSIDGRGGLDWIPDAFSAD